MCLTLVKVDTGSLPIDLSPTFAPGNARINPRQEIPVNAVRQEANRKPYWHRETVPSPHGADGLGTKLGRQKWPREAPRVTSLRLGPWFRACKFLSWKEEGLNCENM
jgi:hypothetical protein